MGTAAGLDEYLPPMTPAAIAASQTGAPEGDGGRRAGGGGGWSCSGRRCQQDVCNRLVVVAGGAWVGRLVEQAAGSGARWGVLACAFSMPSERPTGCGCLLLAACCGRGGGGSMPPCFPDALSSRASHPSLHTPLLPPVAIAQPPR